jgi:hypothetical protein
MSVDVYGTAIVSMCGSNYLVFINASTDPNQFTSNDSACFWNNAGIIRRLTCCIPGLALTYVLYPTVCYGWKKCKKWTFLPLRWDIWKVAPYFSKSYIRHISDAYKLTKTFKQSYGLCLELQLIRKFIYLSWNMFVYEDFIFAINYWWCVWRSTVHLVLLCCGRFKMN